MLRRSLGTVGNSLKEKIKNVKKTIVVASGKGGVGKSTVSVNLAVALSKLGNRTGILDADIFGPSIPKMMNLSGKAQISDSGLLIPKYNHGLQVMSIGFLIDSDSSIVWRGLMVMKGIQQLVRLVKWDDLDILVIDMPPGTGDVQLSISQLVDLDGAIIVSTPQDISLIDAKKGIDMFSKVKVPILGMVENMSLFTCSNCGATHSVFGRDGVVKTSSTMGIDFLGSVPLDAKICEYSDQGKPIELFGESQFKEIAEKVLLKLSNK